MSIDLKSYGISAVLALALTLLVFSVAPEGFAQDVESLDDQLEALLLDDLQKELPADALKEDAAKTNQSGQNEAGNSPEGENPLARIGQQMRAAETRLAEGKTPEETQQIQNKIVDDLAALIKQAQQQKKNQSSASKPSPESRRSQVKQPKRRQQPQPASGDKNSKNPAEDSTARLGKADAVDAERQQRQDQIKELWGHLPERAREQMLQSTSDKFLPKYKVLIEKYFRRLAEDSSEEL